MTAHEKIHTIVSECLHVRLRLINRLIGGIYDRTLAPHGIKCTQFTILAAVSAMETTTSRQLAKVLHMDPSTVSRTLNILKKNHWLDTAPSGDGKILNIHITPAGLDKLEQAYPEWEKAQKEALEILGQGTFDTLVSTGTRYLEKNING